MSASPRRAAILARVSTAKQARFGLGLDVQLEQGHEQVEKHGWTLVGEFVDKGVSGTLFDRPAVNELLAKCRAREIDIVVLFDASRASRDEVVDAQLRLALFKAEVATCINGQVFEATDEGMLVGGLLGAVAAYDRRKMVKRMAAGQRQRANIGGWPGGDPPFGTKLVYVPEPGVTKPKPKPAIDPAEADVVYKAVVMIVDRGMSTWETAAELNALGFRPRKAPRWSHTNLRRILTNRTLIGEMVWARDPSDEWTKLGHHHSTGKYGPPISVKIPRLLDDARWRQLQAALAAANAGKPASRGAGVYLLSGKDNRRLWAPCGGCFHGVHRGDRDLRQYICAHGAKTPRTPERCDCERIRAGEIEAVVKGEIRRLLEDPARLLRMATDFLELRAETMGTEDDQLAEVDTKIGRLERALAGAYQDGLGAGLDPQALKAATEGLADDLTTLRRRRAQVAAWREQSAAESGRRERLWQLAELGHRLDTMTIEEWRQLLALLNVRVKVLEFCEPTDEWPHPWEIKITGEVYDDLLNQLDSPGDAPAWGLRSSGPIRAGRWTPSGS